MISQMMNVGLKKSLKPGVFNFLVEKFVASDQSPH